MRGTQMALAIALTAIVGGAGVVACGDEDPTDPDPIADCLEQAGVTGPAVAIRGFEFRPAALTVTAGETVTWVNCEEPNVDPHTTTADNGAWNSGLLEPGETFSRTFGQAGTFPYHCTPHPNMQATVIVETE